MSILYQDQEQIAHDIYNHLEQCELFNIPTGRGKTFILLDVAIRAFKEHRNVIISVSNNYLVREMYRTAQSFFNRNGKYPINIKIGAENYIDLVKLATFYRDGTLAKYCKESSLKSFIDQMNERHADNNGQHDVFFDEFNEAVEYRDIAYTGIVKRLISKTSTTKTELAGITITNHYYLLSKSIYDQSFDIGDYTLLIDEVHEIGDVFMQINTDSFSFFEYKNMMMQAKKTLADMDDFRGKIRLSSALHKQGARASRLLSKHINSDLVGLYTTKTDAIESVRQDAAILLTSEDHKVIHRHAERLTNENSYIKKTDQFRQAISIEDAQNNSRLSIGLYYSPSKGYPTLSVSSENPLGKLNKLFWQKVRRFAGVSGSTTSSFEPTVNEVRYGYSRIGYSVKDDNRKIHFYDRVFDRKNVNIYLPTKELYEGISKDSVYDEAFDPVNSPFYDKIIEIIHLKNHQKNTMVVCSGYKEAEYLAGLYRLKYNDCNIHVASSGEKPLVTLKRFKQYGGIFFATKNYATGTSLEGNHLERLFILKLPYPDYTTKIWQELKRRGTGIYFKNQQREMLIALIQTLGRLARTPTDMGDIYLLDYNLTTQKKDKKDILKILETYGMVHVYMPHNAPQIKQESKKEIHVDMDALFG